jgi:hypothetical protein
VEVRSSKVCLKSARYSEKGCEKCEGKEVGIGKLIDSLGTFQFLRPMKMLDRAPMEEEEGRLPL